METTILESFVALAMSSVVPFVVDKLKKQNIKGEWALVTMAIVGGIIYAAFEMFAPVELKQGTAAFAAQVGFYAHIIYSMFNKKPLFTKTPLKRAPNKGK